MSNRFGMGILASLEDEEEALLEPIQEEETTLEEDIQEDADNIENAVAVDEAEVEKAEDQQDLLEDAADEMEELQETLEAMKTAGDVPAWAAKMFSQRLEHISRRTGARFATPSVESMGQSGSWTDSLEASLKENAAKAWEAIKKFFANMVEGFYRMMDSMFSGAERIAKRATGLAAAVKGKDINADEAKARLEKLSGAVLGGACFVAADGKSGKFIAESLEAAVKETSEEVGILEVAMGRVQAMVAEIVKKQNEATGEIHSLNEPAELNQWFIEHFGDKAVMEKLNKIYSDEFAKLLPGGWKIKSSTSTVKFVLGSSVSFSHSPMSDDGKAGVVDQVAAFFGTSGQKVENWVRLIQLATTRNGIFSRESFRKLKKAVDGVKQTINSVPAGDAGRLEHAKMNLISRRAVAQALKIASKLRSIWLGAFSSMLTICAAYAGV